MAIRLAGCLDVMMGFHLVDYWAVQMGLHLVDYWDVQMGSLTAGGSVALMGSC